MPTFACPYCGKSFQAAASSDRVAVNCPHCAEPFEISDPGAPPVRPQAAAWTPPPLPPNPYASPQVASSSPFAPNANPTHRASGFECPLCKSHATPLRKSRISNAGWATVILLAIFCFPVFWVGFFMKEDYMVCGTCGVPLGG
jgi:hypothetical protein